MKTIQEIKTDIDVLVRKQGNQGALKLGDVLDEIVDTISITLSSIPDVATFSAAVPSTATEIKFAYSGDVNLTGYTKTTSIGVTIDVYANDTKYVIVSPLPIYAPSSCSSMFASKRALTSLDLSNFNTTNVTLMSYMFSDCAALTSLNLSNFNTTNVEDMYDMFDGCSGLTTIIANNWSAAGDSSGMFNGCTSLVGGNGTTYDSNHTDASYAHIDVTDNPGYFTAPA